MTENEDIHLNECNDNLADSELSPRSKKSRLSRCEKSDTWKIISVVNPKYTENAYSRNAAAFRVKDRTKISSIVKKLDNIFAFPDKDRFIKRVRIKEGSERDISILIHIFEQKKEIHSLNAFTEKYQEKLNELRPISDGCDIFITSVPGSAPRTRSQFEQARAIWPCHFHQDKILESIINCTKDDIWGRPSMQKHIANMKHTLINSIETNNATTIVDPKT